MSENFLILVAVLQDLNFFRVIRGKVRMENIVHPQTGVNIRKLFDEFPDKIELRFSVHKAEEIASHLMLLPERKVSLDDAPVWTMHPLRIDERSSVLLQNPDILSGVLVVSVEMEADNIRLGDGFLFDLCINAGLFQPAVRMLRSGPPDIRRLRLHDIFLAKPCECFLQHRHGLVTTL